MGSIDEGGVEVRRLVKEFPGVRALDGLDLHIRRGELYGLVGPNASGKTTLIRILVGLDAATSGRARVLGARPGSLARDVGYMPQDEALYPDLSIMENIAFFAGLYGVAARGREREVLDLVKLWPERDRLVADLSGGTRRRVSLAASLVHDPRALFLDEPTVGVDPLLRNAFWDSFRERAAEGASLLITTHHLDEARRCDRVGFLWRGRLIREASPAKLMEDAGTTTLEEAFVHFVGAREAGA